MLLTNDLWLPVSITLNNVISLHLPLGETGSEACEGAAALCSWAVFKGGVFYSCVFWLIQSKQPFRELKI
jgi:hypothetical protein